MPARGRRSAKPFTRRRSAAAFRLRPPVPRMNLSPNRGREDGAAVRPGPPGVVRLRPLLAGRQVLPGYGYGCPFRRSVAHPAFRSPFRRSVTHPAFRSPFRRSVTHPAFRSPFRRHGLPTPFRRRPFIGGLLSAAFCRRPFSAARPGATVCRHLFADVLFSAARPFGAAPLFFVPDGTVRSAPPLSSLPPLVSAPSRLCPLSSLPPLVSAPSRLCPLSALSPLVSAPSPLCPLSALSPLRSVPSPLRPLSAPSPLRSVPFLSPSPLLAGRRFVAFFSVRGLKNRKNCLDL